ncbi:probable transcription factor At1g61730 [Oryza brachyantha]|uniref:probable transcription factor At1g61730 n=1 Tax=Oryza brachyantha TaxID=4533 RepID=UPI001ADB53B7|nr:probable transcription factor At1g61730 [Oryza brachyantha]
MARSARRRRPPPPPPPPRVSSSEETASDESEEEEAVATPVVPNKGEESDSSDEGESEDEEEAEEDMVKSSATNSRAPPPKNLEGEEEDEPSESEKAPQLPPKKQAFQRIWSTEDEVRILEALAAHREEHGALPQGDALAASLAGILDKPGCDRRGLQGKISTLKRRYKAIAKKGGELPSKGDDRLLFDLSKRIWGSQAANGATREFDEMCELYPHLAEEVKAWEEKYPGLFKRDFGRIDDNKARALDMKIKKQRLAEMNVEMRSSNLTRQVGKVFAELAKVN